MDTSQNNTKRSHNQIFMVICSVPQGIFVLRSDISRHGLVWPGVASRGPVRRGGAEQGKARVVLNQTHFQQRRNYDYHKVR